MKSILQLIKNAIPFDQKKPFKASGNSYWNTSNDNKRIQRERLLRRLLEIIAYRLKK